VAGQLLHRRAVVFLISDFQSSGPESQTRLPLRKALRQTNRRHDLVAVRIEDPRERTLPDLGVLSLEDAESGEVIEIDTGDAAIRRRFSEEASKRALRLLGDIRSEGVDTLELSTDSPYLPALQRFFKSRERRRI
jgi:hypothetical protein